MDALFGDPSRGSGSGPHLVLQARIPKRLMCTYYILYTTYYILYIMYYRFHMAPESWNMDLRCFGVGVGGQSYSNFLASTATPLQYSTPPTPHKEPWPQYVGFICYGDYGVGGA